MKALPMRVILAGMLALLFLAGCGAGGGGGDDDGPAGGVVGYFSDAGFGPPTASQQEIGDLQQREFNTLALSDLVFLNPDGRAARFSPRCAGDECVVSVQGSTFRATSASLRLLQSDTAITPVMSGPGIHVARLRGRTSDGNAIHGYGAWMEHNAFSTEFIEAADKSTVNSESGGWSPRTNPIDGPATWLGAMVGTDYSAGAGNLKTVQGLAALEVDFDAVTVDVALTRITDLESGARHADMRWSDLAMTGGTFRGAGMEGRFYGPGHEQAGGVFDRNRINGAFGARRF